MAMGYQIKAKITCDGCGGVYQFGYRVTDGPVTGVFHSPACYEKKRREFDAKNEAAES